MWTAIILLALVSLFNFWAIGHLAGAVLALQRQEKRRLELERAELEATLEATDSRLTTLRQAKRQFLSESDKGSIH